MIPLLLSASRKSVTVEPESTSPGREEEEVVEVEEVGSDEVGGDNEFVRCSNRSVKVVFPESTWAEIEMLRKDDVEIEVEVEDREEEVERNL